MMNQKIIKRVVMMSTLFLVGCSALTQLRLDMADKLFGREPLNAPTALTEIVPTNTVKLNWSAQMGETGRYDYTPVVEAGYLYAANAKGELAKLNITNGQEEWRVNVGETISGGVGAGGGLVLVGTSRGNVLAYDVDGKRIWSAEVSSEVLSAPRYFDSKVIVRSGDNHIYGLDAADGTRKWVYTRQVPALSLRSSAGVVVDGGVVYSGFSGGKMVAIHADTGQLLWEATVAIPRGVTEIERIADITSLPVVSGPVVYAVAYQGRIAAVDRRSGEVLWNREISSYNGLAFNEEKLYVSHALGSFYSLDYSTGRTLWRQGDLLNRRLTTPLVMNELVATGDLEGYVHFMNVDNGKFAARMQVGSDAVMSLAAGNTPSQLIVATRNGGLYAMTVSGSTASPVAELPQEEDEDSVGGVDLLQADQHDEEGQSKSILFQNKKPLLSPVVPEADDGFGIQLPPAQ